MKLFFTLIACCAVLNEAGAQRVDLDRLTFSATYRDLPRISIDSSYHTFSVVVEGSPGLLKKIEEINPAEVINIPGWRKLNDHAHIQVNTKMEDVFIENTELKERIQINKDKNGKETSRKKYHYVAITYSFDARAQVSDFKGNLILNISLMNRESKRLYKTQEFSSFLEATYFLMYNKLNVTETIALIVAAKALNQLNYYLSENIGYPIRIASDYLWVLDSRRHPEYDVHRQAVAIFRQAMFQMRADQPLDEIKVMLQPAISYFEKVKRNYSSNSKSDRKLRYASYFNLSKIYYYLDDPDNAMREAGQLILNDYDARDGKDLESFAINLKFLMDQNKAASRHFSQDIEKFEGPGMTNASK